MKTRAFPVLPRAVVVACLGLLFAGALVGLVAVVARHLDRPTGVGPLEVRVDEGMSARAIGERLQDLGLIRSARLFAAAARLHGVAGHLEAGTYRLDGTRPTSQILDAMLEAPVEMIRLTVPEGITRHEIAGLLQRLGVADSAAFVAAAERESLIAQLGLAAPTLEGYLFPETYFLPPGVDEEEIARHMVAEFFDVFADSLFDRLNAIGLTLHQTVTLASIVEREAMVPQERPVISAIFLRRLGLGRRLESCATVEYALGVHKLHLTNEDLKVESPYNTYLYGGLPPGPIGNPGAAALMATLHPADTDYLYFVARGDGTHEFSRTNNEHERAKREIRRQARANGLAAGETPD